MGVDPTLFVSATDPVVQVPGVRPSFVYWLWLPSVKEPMP